MSASIMDFRLCNNLDSDTSNIPEKIDQCCRDISKDILEALRAGDLAAIKFKDMVLKVEATVNSQLSTEDIDQIYRSMLRLDHDVSGSYGFAHVLVKTIHESGFAIPTPWYAVFEIRTMGIDTTENISDGNSTYDNDSDREKEDDDVGDRNVATARPHWVRINTNRIVSNVVET